MTRARGRVTDRIPRPALYAGHYLRVVGRLTRSYVGPQRLTCACCGSSSRFAAHGLPVRLNARCMNCGALERHRLMALAINDRALMEPGARVLHFAPESSLSAFIRRREVEYTTVDLLRDDVDVKADIRHVPLPDGAYDAILCSHVLEHVDDDAAAMTELYRLCAPAGCLVAAVPLIETWDTTYEDDRVKTEADRERHFGQYDHVRYYGRDVDERLRQAGFVVDRFVAGPGASLAAGLMRGDVVFLCRKPPSAGRG